MLEFEPVVLSEIYESQDNKLIILWIEDEVLYLLQIVTDICIFQSSKNVCIFICSLFIWRAIYCNIHIKNNSL